MILWTLKSYSKSFRISPYLIVAMSPQSLSWLRHSMRNSTRIAAGDASWRLSSTNFIFYFANLSSFDFSYPSVSCKANKLL